VFFSTQKFEDQREMGWKQLHGFFRLLLLFHMTGCGQQTHSMVPSIHWSLQAESPDTHMGFCLPNSTGPDTSPLYQIWLYTPQVYPSLIYHLIYLELIKKHLKFNVLIYKKIMHVGFASVMVKYK
jgi:hypothetical protein